MAERKLWKVAIRRLAANKLAILSLLVLISIIIIGVGAEQFAGHEPNRQTLAARMLPPVWAEGGKAEYPLGTDQLGRDVLSRLIHGTRSTLFIASLSMLWILVVGLVLGLMSGYFRGIADTIIMRVVDSQLALPYILLGIVVMALFGRSFTNLILVLVLSYWANLTRIVRAEVLSIAEMEYVHAARALGASHVRILTRHVLPNIMSPIIVVCTTQLGMVILIEASLSYLGLGLPAEIPTWGGMLSEARDFMSRGWWLTVFPGIAIALVVTSVNILGDWLRDVLDPRSVR